MITLPKEFTATKYDGYFWNTVSHELYSIKVGGILRPLPRHNPNPWNRLQEQAYAVSVAGKRKYLTMSYLHNLPHVNSEIRSV